jgi:hypothetical protein
MRKQIIIYIFSLSCVLSIKAQLYTPNSVIQGNSINDNIGIGTSSPSGILEIQKNSDAYENMLVLTHKNSIGGLHSIWKFQQHTNGNLVVSGTKGNWIFEKKSDRDDIMMSFIHRSSSGTAHSVWNFENHTTGNFVISNSQSKSFFFDTEGSVGIGTSSTGSHKLAVEGSIGAREIEVEATGWSDFVFDDEYDLKSLMEVEEFINNNNHLPDIPSEKEVLEKGINLGEVDAKLLQKIEELTLYLIEQNKMIIKQQKEIEDLKKKVK